MSLDTDAYAAVRFAFLRGCTLPKMVRARWSAAVIGAAGRSSRDFRTASRVASQYGFSVLSSMFMYFDLGLWFHATSRVQTFQGAQ